MPEGFLTQHMAAHIVAMNVVAPACALAAARLFPSAFHAASRGGLLPSASIQIALLWGWHTPAMLALAVQTPATMAAMHATLFAAALWFWSAVIGATRRGDWTPLAALLVTGKLFCLMGLLLAFAPRVLYAQVALIQSCFGSTGPSLIEDQQLAGLLMLAACPMVYVAAAIVIARRWLRRIDAEGGWTLAPRDAS